jgi:uncharacterized protein (TIGR02466 family)
MFTSVDSEFKHKENLIDYCYGMKEAYPDNYTRSNMNGWQSPPFVKEQNPVFFKQPFFIDFWNQFLATSKEIKLHESNQFFLGNIWININSPGSYNITHNHPGAMISGAYYVKVPSNSGGIVFDNNLATLSLLYKFCDNEAMKTNHKIDPVEGQMVLFSSYLPHYVQQNNSDEDRISISFNVVVVEKPSKKPPVKRSSVFAY